MTELRIDVPAATTSVVLTLHPAEAPPDPPDPPAQTAGVWTSAAELAARPTSGPAWTALLAAAHAPATPNLANQDDMADVRVMARGLVFARTGDAAMRAEVVAACEAVVGTEGGARALALGRNLIGYVIGADLVGHRSDRFVAWLRAVRNHVSTEAGSIIQCHEDRPNNWGTHCGASRAAIAAYLDDKTDFGRCAMVFKGWLGDRAAYAGFSYGDLWWQANAAAPVGINPKGTMIQGHSVDGVLPDDQRRSGPFAWPPPKQNYVYEALQGAIAQAVVLSRRGFDVWNWSDKALLRAFTWLHSQAGFPAAGDDTWEPWIVNKAYGARFPAPLPSSPGKNVGFTCFTHGS